jgi:DNA-binding winged helix-turn-helix (wHTH) protein/TolB-like protein
MDSRRYRFGLFAFDAAAGELRRDGELVRLQGQPAVALGCLLANAGRVVTREELQKAIWGDETHVDFERGLNFCIGQLRAALGDDADTPRYVRTIPRRGYQFIGEVEVVGGVEVAGEVEAVAGKGGVGERAGGRPASQPSAQASSGPGESPIFLPRVAFACLMLLLLAASLAAGYWLHARAFGKKVPTVAVLRFDNETADPTVTRFSDGLTDSVVERLTAVSAGRYDVIGNAAILRLPREQRDLQAIAASLGANYVVLGQVQSNGAQTRILAHLIRLPDQKHLWVVRTDRQVADPLALEAEIAQQVAAEFAPRVERDAGERTQAAVPGK